MPHTPKRVVTIEVDVTAAADGTISITCTPNTADVTKDTKHALLAFTLNTTGFRFPATDAITMDSGKANSEDAAKNFPYASWTLSDTRAALYDNNKSASNFDYTVTVVNTTTGQEYRIDPVINNGGGGVTTGDC
ncbi:MAG: hypothetical protein ACJ8G1_28040 [Vitreoscilla sp.]|jgi:hypothetical protein